MKELPFVALKVSWLEPPSRRGKAEMKLSELPEDIVRKIADNYCATRRLSLTASEYAKILQPMLKLVRALRDQPWRLSEDELCPIRGRVLPASFHGGALSFYRSASDSHSNNVRMLQTVSAENMEDLVKVNLKYGAMAHIKRFGWHGLSVTSDSWPILATAFQEGFLADLAGLTINDCSLRDAGCVLLATAFTEAKRQGLLRLTLSKNGITKVGCTALAQAFLADAVPNIIDLDLVENPIGADGCTALAGAIARKKLGKLASLDLDSCGIGDDGCAALAKSLGEDVLPNLHMLDLRFNEIANRGCKALVKGLGAHARTSFTHLDLTGNHITDGARGALLSLLKMSAPAGKLPRLMGVALSDQLSPQVVEELNAPYVVDIVS